MASDRDERIRERAHALWEQGGHQDGQHEHHWQRATAEIAAEDADTANSARSGGGKKAKKGGAKPAEPKFENSDADEHETDEPTAVAEPEARRSVPDEVAPKFKKPKGGATDIKDDGLKEGKAKDAKTKKSARKDVTLPAASSPSGKAGKRKPELDVPSPADVKGRGRKAR